MQIAISNLPFMGFRDAELIKLAINNNYDIEVFYEFGTDVYWDTLLEPLAQTNVKISVHAPCVSVNLADIEDKNWLKIYRDTIAFAKRYKAEFVVLHTNEGWQGDKMQVRKLVEERILQIATLAQTANVKLLIENVGLITKGNLLYDFEEYCELLDRFPTCGALIDTGHANVNSWQLAILLEKLGERVQAMHLHDNDGCGDTHLCIGQGKISWSECLQAAKLYTPQAKLVLEYAEISKLDLPKHLEALRSQYKI